MLFYQQPHKSKGCTDCKILSFCLKTGIDYCLFDRNQDTALVIMRLEDIDQDFGRDDHIRVLVHDYKHLIDRGGR